MERLAKDIFLNILTSTAFHNSQKVKMFFYLTVYRYLKTVIIMAKIDLKFLSVDTTHDDMDCDWIKTRASSIDCDGVYDEVCVEMKEGENINTIYLDVSTAIKFAKTLRTEINKIKGI